MRKVLQAVAYRGLKQGSDLADVRDELKRAACRVFNSALTVADVQMLDALLRQAEGHRRKLQGLQPSPHHRPVRSFVRRPVTPPEVPMRRHTDTETLSLLAELERDDQAAPPAATVDTPGGTVQTAAPAPPAPEVKPPANFRELVAKRQEAFHAGEKPVWMEE